MHAPRWNRRFVQRRAHIRCSHSYSILCGAARLRSLVLHAQFGTDPPQKAVRTRALSCPATAGGHRASAHLILLISSELWVRHGDELGHCFTLSHLASPPPSLDTGSGPLTAVVRPRQNSRRTPERMAWVPFSQRPEWQDIVPIPQVPCARERESVHGCVFACMLAAALPLPSEEGWVA